MLMIDPRPRAAIRLPNTCIICSVPTMFTSTMRRTCSAGRFSIVERLPLESGAWSTPALLTRTSGAPADHLVQLVRRDAAARRLHHDVVRADRVAAGQVARDDEALSHLGNRRLLALVDLLDAAAERAKRAIEVAYQLAQPDRLQRE